jgi:hypothetical protein
MLPWSTWGFFSFGPNPVFLEVLRQARAESLIDSDYPLFCAAGRADFLFLESSRPESFPFGAPSSVRMVDLSAGSARRSAVSECLPHRRCPAGHAGPSGVPLNTRLYLLVTDPAAGDFFGGFSEIGIFSASTWLAGPGLTTNEFLSLSQVDSPEEIFQGSLASEGSLRLAVAAPEPGGIALIAATTLFCILRRRRANSADGRISA